MTHPHLNKKSEIIINLDSELIVINASEPDIIVDDKPSSLQEVRNYDEFGKTEDEQQDKFSDSKAINRLGILVSMLVGLCEDFPVILAVFYQTVMPMCGVPAKQNARSGVILATIISSM